MKALFLDIDGVLNGIGFLKGQVMSGGRDRIDRETVGRINQIVEATDAQIVLTSSWRLENALSSIDTFLRGYGLEPHISEKTSLLDHRGAEISAWLDRKDVAQYAILDDDAVLGHDHHFVRTRAYDGVKDQDVT